jgi:hypothetical protein
MVLLCHLKQAHEHLSNLGLLRRTRVFSCIDPPARDEAHKASLMWVQGAKSAGDAEGEGGGSGNSHKETDILTQAARGEGMGTTYKVFAITPQAAATPVPF